MYGIYSMCKRMEKNIEKHNVATVNIFVYVSINKKKTKCFRSFSPGKWSNVKQHKSNIKIDAWKIFYHFKMMLFIGCLLLLFSFFSSFFMLSRTITTYCKIGCTKCLRIFMHFDNVIRMLVFGNNNRYIYMYNVWKKPIFSWQFNNI